MDKDKMLDYFNDREATLFRDELGSNARYHELLQKKLAAEDAHRKMVGEAAWKRYLQLDELCNELESVRYQAMYLAGAADLEKVVPSILMDDMPPSGGFFFMGGGLRWQQHG